MANDNINLEDKEAGIFADISKAERQWGEHGGIPPIFVLPINAELKGGDLLFPQNEIGYGFRLLPLVDDERVHLSITYPQMRRLLAVAALLAVFDGDAIAQELASTISVAAEACGIK